MSDTALFPLTDEHKMIRDAARDFAANEIAPIAAEFDESGEFPLKTIKKMGEMGFMGLEVPDVAAPNSGVVIRHGWLGCHQQGCDDQR